MKLEIFNIPWKPMSVNFWLHGFVAWSNDIDIGPRLWHSPLTMAKAFEKIPSANPSMNYTKLIKNYSMKI